MTADFANGDTLTIDGLKLADLRLAAGTARLELDFTGDGARDVYDQYALAVRVSWPGGAYDGWDRQTTDAYASLTPSPVKGTVIQFW